MEFLSWLVVWNMNYIFPFSWECNPNWRTPSFFRGVGSTTNQMGWNMIPQFSQLWPFSIISYVSLPGGYIFPMDFLSKLDLPLDFLWISYGFPMDFQSPLGILPLSRGVSRWAMPRSPPSPALPWRAPAPASAASPVTWRGDSRGMLHWGYCSSF